MGARVAFWAYASVYVGVFLLAIYVWNLQTELAILGLVVPLGVTLWVERQNRNALQQQDKLLHEILRRLPERQH